MAGAGLIALVLFACAPADPEPIAEPVAPVAVEAPPAAPLAVWIDADPSVGVPNRDVDDGVALLQAFRSPELAVRGVSTVFGNAELPDADRIGRELVTAWSPETPVYTGAAGPGLAKSPATEALAAALDRERLTILVLGPATNLAALVRNHPEAARNIDRVLLVAGRNPGQRFTTGSTNTRGHRDFNFEKDPEAFQVLLDSDLELVLAGFEISREVWVRDADLQRWAQHPDSARLVEPAQGWLGLWRDTFAVDGFNPFDALAVGVLLRPELIECDARTASIEHGPDDVTEAAMQGDDAATKPYLVARPPVPGGRAVTWCHSVQSQAFLDDLTGRLTGR